MKNLLSLGLLLSLLACEAKKSDSTVKEAPDSPNAISRFEIAAMPSYSEILSYKQIQTERLPWTDTYWPYTSKVMARRWAEISPKSDEIGLVTFLKDQLVAVETQSLNPQLSPAEKYDFLFNLRHGKTLDKAQLEQAIQGLEGVMPTFVEATDLAGKRAAVGQIADAFKASTAINQWAPMTSEGWQIWLNYTRNERYQYMNDKESGESWSWMGYCHGWAPAALMHEPPKHAVLAKIDGKEVLMSEGDIRGLLTKAWSSHSPRAAQYFLGRRCNENVAEAEGNIPAHEDGRGVSGTMKRGADTIDFTMFDEYLPGAAYDGRRIYQVSLKDQAGSLFMIERTRENRVSYFLATSVEQAKGFVTTGSTAGLEQVTNVKFYGCWDVNPASFHTVMLELIGKQKAGLVMDRTRTGQVWNQPIHGAKFEIGELLDAAEVDDNQFRHRAPGTRYLVQVKAEVYWVGEPARPEYVYAPDFDRKHLYKSDYEYTLEFDADQKLIGGEWGNFGPNQPNAVIPDFLYGFKKGSVPEDAMDVSFDYSGVIAPIHACSLSDGEIKTMDVGGKSVRYTECELQKVTPPAPVQ